MLESSDITNSSFELDTSQICVIFEYHMNIVRL